MDSFQTEYIIKERRKRKKIDRKYKGKGVEKKKLFHDWRHLVWEGTTKVSEGWKEGEKLCCHISVPQKNISDVSE